jgi:hypothetical protein
MKAHRLANIVMAGVIAAAFAAVLSTSHLLDQHTDKRAEWAESTSLKDAQFAARMEAIRERGAAQLCAKLHGNAGYRWANDGTLVCTDHKGRATEKKGHQL